MGQQQLLLLLVGTVLVGVAIASGAGGFRKNRTESARDRLTGEAMRIASDVQAWRAKPKALGGGGGTEWPSGLGEVYPAGPGKSPVDASSGDYETADGKIQWRSGPEAPGPEGARALAVKTRVTDPSEVEVFVVIPRPGKTPRVVRPEEKRSN